MSKNKPFWRKYIIAAGFVLLLIFAALVFNSFTQKSNYNLNSKKIIREAVAKQLNKDSNKLTDEDFVAVERLDLSRKEVYDIKLLRKFKNLEELNLSYIPLLSPDIPKWMAVLGRLHVIGLYKMYSKSYKNKYLIDLSPLQNLSHLKTLYISNTAIKDIKPLSKIENLREINVDVGLLYDHGIYKDGNFPKTLFIGGREFSLGLDNSIDNSKEPLPTIKVSNPGYFFSTTHDAEMIIKDEVEKALK